jgi:hypothetical protein
MTQDHLPDLMLPEIRSRIVSNVTKPRRLAHQPISVQLKESLHRQHRQFRESQVELIKLQSLLIKDEVK